MKTRKHEEDEEGEVPSLCSVSCNYNELVDEINGSEVAYNMNILMKRKHMNEGNLRVENEISVLKYAYEMIQEKSELRKEQMKLTIFSMLRCFDFFNDMLFFLKIFYEHCACRQNKNIEHENLYKIITIWLFFLHIISFFTFHSRKFFIVNMIPEEHNDLFKLFAVFRKIKSIQSTEVNILHFYSRIEKSYIIINKFFEDIPQFILFLLHIWLNGEDTIFFIFFIFYSIFYVALCSFTHVSSYPRLFSVLRSRFAYLPGDSLIEHDAAPTNKFFCLYAWAVFFVWSLLTLTTRRFATAPWILLIHMQFWIFSLMSLIFLLLFLYFHFDDKQNFYLNSYNSFWRQV
ncbi:hypothetical protein PGO_040290 [Plasmodium gonderi]|uniref:Uncharacterized protein n=1 Tax=Plasmodium gonderi TaxID=77519 RepID=A0A1Y1JA89_PLAGO|nr:hypothetical protein PGO_040290 [Plasmodium gonderi]GAW79429.1 hypothetical protein PGO_040290 [Plasmodium gonderi]